MRLKEKGFTLIELVMVIAIVGILAAIAIPKFVDLSGAAKVSATKGSLGAVRSVLAIKYAQTATGGAAASFPAALAAADFADGQLPLNSINSTRGVASLAATVGGLITNAAAGFWYVTDSTNVDYGRAGAYSDGTINTSSY